MNYSENFSLNDICYKDWYIKNEPNLIKKIYDYYFNTNIEISYDSKVNSDYLLKVSNYINDNFINIYNNLNDVEKFILDIMTNSFGWIVIDSLENISKIISLLFGYNEKSIYTAISSLTNKCLIFKYFRIKKYDLLFVPPIIMRNIKNIKNNATKDSNVYPDNLLSYNILPLIAGFISYVITYSPRSSEQNNIHSIDLKKMTEFFANLPSSINIENIIKKLIKFGFFQKFNNRIGINKYIFDTITNLSINEQLFIIFLYDFMDKFDFSKSAFMTLKIIAKKCYNGNSPISLKELFFYFINNELFFKLKSEPIHLKLFLKQQEFKFIYYIKSLISEKIIKLYPDNKENISINNESIIINEPHLSILNNVDFSALFKDDKFTIESNYEILVEPYINPSVLFKLALISEPVTIQTVSIFKITKESIYRSLAYGVKKEEIISFLENNSKHAIPENVKKGIENFISDLDLNIMEKYKIIQVNSHFSQNIKDLYKNKIIELEPHTFLVFSDEIAKKIEDYCKTNHIGYKFIKNFLYDKQENLYLQDSLDHNIKHLHKIKGFFEYYGENLSDEYIKIDNQI